MELPDRCTCSQAERLATGWGFRLAQWSLVGNPVLIRIHYGCDRPLFGLGQAVTIAASRATLI